jgi:hypothetical protein
MAEVVVKNNGDRKPEPKVPAAAFERTPDHVHADYNNGR